MKTFSPGLISPSGDKVAVSLAVYPDAADLDASVEMGKAMAERKTTGQVYDRMFVRHWDTWNDHTQNHLFVQSIDANELISEIRLDENMLLSILTNDERLHIGQDVPQALR